jgi:hypothetical protein
VRNGRDTWVDGTDFLTQILESHVRQDPDASAASDGLVLRDGDRSRLGLDPCPYKEIDDGGELDLLGTIGDEDESSLRGRVKRHEGKGTKEDVGSRRRPRKLMVSSLA